MGKKFKINSNNELDYEEENESQNEIHIQEITFLVNQEI